MLSILWFLLVGAIAGWLAGEIMEGRGFGVVGNIVVGILGAILGGFLFRMAGILLLGGMLGDIFRAMIGAIVLLAIVGFVKKR